VFKVIETLQPICVKRILIPIDSSSHSFAALQAAVFMAGHYDAVLKGVYVEDIVLLGLAEMPFPQEVGDYSAIVREISIDNLTRGISVQSKWVTTTFQKLINRSQLDGDITILRGKVIDIIMQESQDCDLLIIGKSGKNTLGKRRLGSTTNALIQRNEKSILLIEEGNQIGYPLIALYDPSPIGKLSLETARDLLGSGETLVILLDEKDPDIYKENRSALSKWAANHKINISIQNYTKRSFDHFLEMINGLKNGLFILPYIKHPQKTNIVNTCVEKITLPILLIKYPLTDLFS